jgi:hypothetical protein
MSFVETTNTRVALAQATLRRLNDSIQGELADGLVGFRCECGRLGCNQLIELSREQYEAVRADPRRFAVVHSHEVPELEHVVEDHGRYAVVEAHPKGPAHDIAIGTDPRATRRVRRP